MKKHIITVLLTIGLSTSGWFLFYNYYPIWQLDGLQDEMLGATVTTISGTDTMSAFPTTYNANLAAMNSAKIEISTTTLPNITTLANLTGVTASDLSCTNCINATEIEDVYLINTAPEVMPYRLDMDAGSGSSPNIQWINGNNDQFSAYITSDGNASFYNDTGEIWFKASGDYDDYIFISVSGNESAINTVGSSTLNIVSSSGDINFNNNNNATTTIIVESGKAGLGGSIILEDNDGAGCTEISVTNGTILSESVSCP